MFGRNRKLELIIEAMEKGASIALAGFDAGVKATLDALEKDGRLLPDQDVDEISGPVHIDDFVEDGEDNQNAMNIEDIAPDIIKENARKFAEQIGDRISGNDDPGGHPV